MTTELAPITQRSPTVTPLVMTTFAPHQTLSPTRVGPLLREALPGHRAVGVVEAVVGVGDEAAVGEHAVLADLDQLDGGDLHAEVEERAAADADPRRRRRRSATRRARRARARRARAGPRAASRARCRAAASGEASAGGRARQWRRARFHGQRVALVLAPLLRPQLDVGGVHGGRGRYARVGTRQAGKTACRST